MGCFAFRSLFASQTAVAGRAAVGDGSVAGTGDGPAKVEEEDSTTNGPSYRFPLQDSDAWLKHLRDCGYVVVGGAMSPVEVATAKDLLWGGLECTARDGSGLSRSDPETWRDDRNFTSHGLTTRVAQHSGAWHVRGSRGIKKAFAQIWGTEELIVSMDCVIVWRPWWLVPSWRPKLEGLHLDQNPFSKPGLHCVQGMVPLLPVTRQTGGLQVVPGSHTDEAKAQQKTQYPHLEGCGDWCPLFRDEADAVLLLSEPGDLILWDSRTIHGGVVGTGAAGLGGPIDEGDPVDLARLSVTIAMTPRQWASFTVQQLRVKGFQKGENFNHSPHEAGTSTGTMRGMPRWGFKPPELTPEQRSLL